MQNKTIGIKKNVVKQTFVNKRFTQITNFPCGLYRRKLAIARGRLKTTLNRKPNL